MGAYDDLLAASAKVADLDAQLAAARADAAAQGAAIVKGGPDVSNNQPNVNWTAVKGAGYDITFLKVADGDIKDPSYTAARVSNLKAAGFTAWAPYYFGRVASPGNSERNARAECAMAVYFANQTGWGKTGDLPLVYDFETLNGQDAQKAADHLILFLRAYRGLMGDYAWVYTNPATMAQIAPKLSDADAQWLADNHILWLAQYTNAIKPNVPAPWKDWTFWQWTETGTVPGISGNVDLNRANITTAALDRLRLR